MNTKDTISLLCTAFALLVAAAITNGYSLWSFLGNYTVPWFCSALSIALLLLVLTAILSASAPRSIPPSRVLIVTLGVSAALGLGMLTDGIAYDPPPDWTATIAEWAGFTLILLVVFWIPRTGNKYSQTRTPERRDD